MPPILCQPPDVFDGNSRDDTEELPEILQLCPRFSSSLRGNLIQIEIRIDEYTSDPIPSANDGSDRLSGADFVISDKTQPIRIARELGNMHQKTEILQDLLRIPTFPVCFILYRAGTSNPIPSLSILANDYPLSMVDI